MFRSVCQGRRKKLEESGDKQGQVRALTLSAYTQSTSEMSGISSDLSVKKSILNM